MRLIKEFSAEGATGTGVTTESPHRDRVAHTGILNFYGQLFAMQFGLMYLAFRLAESSNVRRRPAERVREQEVSSGERYAGQKQRSLDRQCR